MTRPVWIVRLSDTAEADYDTILRWTAERFGMTQARAYGGRLAATLARLGQGPSVAGAHLREEIARGIHALHMGGRGRHVILFRISSAQDRTIEVLRMLHDAMDLARHAGGDR